MGIYDRDYYRDATRGSLWLRATAPVTLAIMICNVGMFAVCAIAEGTGSELRHAMVLDAAAIFQRGEIWRLVTTVFWHDGVWHVAWNMLFLWWFGRELEMIYGSGEFFAFYLLAGFVASITSALVAWVRHSMVPGVGASAAITAVLVVYALYYPRQPINFYGLFPVEMRWFVAIYLASDAFVLIREGTAPQSLAQVGHLAAATYAFLFKRLDLRFGRIFSVPVPSRVGRSRDRAPVAESIDGRASDDELDAVLEKLYHKGRQSLTPEEEAVLQKASVRFRARR